MDEIFQILKSTAGYRMMYYASLICLFESFMPFFDTCQNPSRLCSAQKSPIQFNILKLEFEVWNNGGILSDDMYHLLNTFRIKLIFVKPYSHTKHLVFFCSSDNPKSLFSHHQSVHRFDRSPCTSKFHRSPFVLSDSISSMHAYHIYILFRWPICSICGVWPMRGCGFR